MPTGDYPEPDTIFVGRPTKKSNYDSLRDAILWLKECADELSALVNSQPPTSTVVIDGFDSGDLKQSARANPEPGWLPCDGRQLSRVEYANLFSAIGTTFGSGNGSTTFNIPDCRGRIVVGTGQAPGLANRQLGDKFGSETIQLEEEHLPRHTHTGTTDLGGEHTHQASTEAAGSHRHSGSSTSSVGNHTHTCPGSRSGDSSGGTAMSTDGFSDGVDRGARTTSAGSHSHAVTITAAPGHIHTATINTAGEHTHGVAVSSVGGDQPHSNIQPCVVINVFIKA